MRLHRLLPLALLAWAATAMGQGHTLVIGGALQDGNAAVWQRLVALAGGPGACVAVLATSAGAPDEAAAAINATLARYGARGETIRVAPRIAGLDIAAAVRDPVWTAKVRGCRGVFFSGGAQDRLLDSLQPGGHSTPLLDAVRAVWQQGGVVAGTSAGAAVMSAVVVRDAPDPLAVMKGRLREGQEWGRGFGFVPAGVIVDQHAVRRGRMARLLPLMLATNKTLGVAVEEDSAALFSGTQIEVLGTKGVLIADTAHATRSAAQPVFNVAGATLHWLEPGDRFDLVTRSVQPAGAKLAGSLLEPGQPGFKGYHQDPAFFADILGEGTIVKAMARLVDGDQRELRGLAWAPQPAADDPAPDTGFEWRLWVDADTRGWLTLQPEATTLAGVRLDIAPVRIQRPVYRPLPSSPGLAPP